MMRPGLRPAVQKWGASLEELMMATAAVPITRRKAAAAVAAAVVVVTMGRPIVTMMMGLR